jgi:hypothetical protein
VIVLDTNLLSEVLLPTPAERIIDWLATIPPRDLCTTAITQAELLLGVNLLPQGRRRLFLSAEIDRMLGETFSGRILHFDSAAAHEFAQIKVVRRRLGRPISDLDAQIGAIARSRGFPLATRNSCDFEDCGIEILNPWLE